MAEKRIGWIGTGVMGAAMCGHLLSAGYPVTVFNRGREKADPIIAKGAVWADTPKAVAQKSDIVFTMVGFPDDVHEVILGDDGVLAGASAGSTVVDMTTSSPDLAQTVYRACFAKGVNALDAPVSGGDIGAREATLAIMVGGDSAVFDAIRPLFEIMGKTIALMGNAGAGQHTKMTNQILIAGTMIGVVESLLYARKAGMDLDQVIDVIGKGAASSWSINNLGRRIADDNFDPGFFIKHFVKDMGIALDEAGRMHLSLPGLALVHQFYVAAMAMGWENLGTQGLYRVLDRMNQKT
ncbi:NAD(P)-dependent oxidoreductase [Desulfosarcina ovata]|uniref:3-hydroxyisobutyrate dehydrogenase n=2 Tax=Desulfosarcina ovata TaxID=83564 RepID=A0A5K8A3Y1_9BACT|nr:NAD(P)-dependent oxidoreductase [Desulfosarcina ovata]BBO80347.1 3-hydroxyisobutyrate dehydrogenase [Desulfosarcina ovata subsp. sediminis]BBO87118.1 3-hydroxyisobutyrate dehydrogenase [Desulfosarcina ovata subsp. ovata]